MLRRRDQTVRSLRVEHYSSAVNKWIVRIVLRKNGLAGHVPARKFAGGLGDVANALQRVSCQRHESARDPARLRFPALRRIPAQAVTLLAVLDELDLAIVGIEPVQLGDAAVRGEQEGIRGYGNHFHRMPGAAVGFSKCGNGAFGGKFPGPGPLALDPDAIEVRRPPDGAGPDERPRDEAVIVEKACDRFKLQSGAIRGLSAVVGPAGCGGSVEVVGARVGNRFAGLGESLVEMPHRREHQLRVHLWGKPIPVAQVCLEEVDVPAIERRVARVRCRGLFQGMAPVHAKHILTAARYPGDAAQLPCRRIPVEAGAEDCEVLARMTDEPGEPGLGVERLPRLEERELTHGAPPSASRGNDRRLPQWP